MPTSSIRQQISKRLARPSGRGVSRSVVNSSPSRVLRMSLVFFLLLSFTTVCVGIVTSVPEARLAGGLRTFSDTWTRLLAAAPWLYDPPQSVPAVPTMRHAADISWAPSAVPDVREPGVIWYGDRLKITFFESLGVTLDGGGANSDHAVAAIFPRMDLSADYAVDEGGSVNIPKLGQFATTGQTIPVLQSKLAAAFERAIGRTSDVHVAIVERQPIHVLGTVRNAGTFKHAPGMFVLQALADAGGIDLGVADTSKAIESIRETERLRQAQDRLNGLLVKQARLIALRENSDTIVLPASIKSRLSETTPHYALSALITGTAATLLAERKSYQQQLSLAERQVRIARVEVAAQNMRADQLKELLAKKEDRLHGLETIAARGSVSQIKLADVNVDISELVARQQDLRVASAQAERGLVQAEIAQAKIELDYSVGREKEIATTQQDIDDCAQTIESMRAVTQVLRNSLPQVADGPAGSHPSLRITRRGAAGFTVIPATETTMLLPGDVVQVSPSDRSDAATAGLAQNMSRLQN